MTPSANLMEFLRGWEGLPGGLPALNAYDDGTGVWTIGYGHTRGVHQRDTITAETAEALLASDLAPIADQVDQMVRVRVPQNEYDALCSFAFNLGAQALRGSTLLLCVNRNDPVAAAGQFTKWDHAGGKELAGLLKRRTAEQHMFSDGDYSARP